MADHLQPVPSSVPRTAMAAAPDCGSGPPERACSTFFFADMVGYSRLISRAGDAAIAELDRFRTLFAEHIAAHDGTLIEYAGDSVFACFHSPLAAVKAAINVQNALASCNEDRDPGQFRVQARIGLHSGEATVRGAGYFGDDVNIAARLEPLAVAGGIALSKATFDAVRTEIFVPVKWLGPQTLKNIGPRIRVYLLVPTGIDARVHMHYLLRRLQQRVFAYRYCLITAALALCGLLVYLISQQLAEEYRVNYLTVAAFTNSQSRGEADYLGQGVAEALRTQLGAMEGLYVVADDNHVDTPLRLEGSIQQSGDYLRIGYRLLRTRDNTQLAGRHINGEVRDIFLLQDRLAGEIAKAVAREFDLPLHRPASSFLTGDTTAYDFYLRGEDALRQPFSHQHTDLAVEMYSKALLFDSRMTSAKVGICRAFIRRYQHTGGVDWLDRAERHCSEAVASDPASAEAYAARATIRELSGDLDGATEDLHTALGYKPQHVSAMLTLARVYRRQDRLELADETYQAVINAQPQRWDVLQAYGFHQIKTGAYQGAVDTYLRLIALTPRNMSAYNALGAAYLYLGEFKSAANAFEKSTELAPDAAALANAGTMYYFLGKYKKAETLFRQAQDLEPDNFVWSANRGDALRQLEKRELSLAQYQLTLQLAERALRRNPANPKALRHAALAHHMLDQTESARLQMEQALQSEPGNVDTLAMYARIACLSGTPGTALSLTEKLIEDGYSAVLLAADPDLSPACYANLAKP